MTSPVDLSEELYFGKHCEKGAVAITLDLLIGNKNYLGKELAHIMIQEIIEQKFSSVTDVFIGPSTKNGKAIRVDEKTVFRTIHDFNPEWGSNSTHVLMHLKTY